MQPAANQRLKKLIDALGMSVRAFSTKLEVPDSNTRNYLDKSTKLNVDYVERIARHFSNVNITWLITGHGEPFLSDPTQTHEQTATNATHPKNFSHAQFITGHGNTQQQGQSTELVLAQKEIESLRQQLQLKDALLAAKDETINALKGTHK